MLANVSLPPYSETYKLQKDWVHVNESRIQTIMTVVSLLGL